MKIKTKNLLAPWHSVKIGVLNDMCQWSEGHIQRAPHGSDVMWLLYWWVSPETADCVNNIKGGLNTALNIKQGLGAES